MYKIKQIPEDFVVKEIPKYELDRGGQYSYFILKKKNWTTHAALQKIAANLKVPLKFLGFAGTKDKRAVTEQMCSAKGIAKERLEKIKIKDIEIRYIGRGKEPVSLGDLEGNEFIITIRNLDKIPKIKNKRILNLFGEQRFSTRNAEIGKALVKKDFKRATEIIEDKRVKEYLKSNPSDYIGALRAIPLKIRKIYIHSYQSLLWNRMAEELRNEKRNIRIPILGFGTETKNKKIKAIVEKILREEKIALRDFIIPQMPELSSYGDERDLFILPKKFRIVEKGKDELNKGKYKIKIKFMLQKGSYATTAIKQIFSSQ